MDLNVRGSRQRRVTGVGVVADRKGGNPATNSDRPALTLHLAKGEIIPDLRAWSRAYVAALLELEDVRIHSSEDVA